MPAHQAAPPATRRAMARRVRVGDDQRPSATRDQGNPPPRRGAGFGQRLGSASSILMIAFVGSRALGLFKFVVLNGAFVSHDLNAFWTAFGLPDTVFLILSGGAMTSALIPTLASLLTDETPHGQQRVWQVAMTVLTMTLLLMGGLTAVAYLLTAPLATLLVGRNTADLPLTIDLIHIMLPQPLFLAISSVLMALFNAHHRFALPALAPLLYNMGLIVGALVGGLLIPVWGIEAAAWGVTLGALAQCLVQLAALPRLRAAARSPHQQRGRRLLWLDLADPAAREVGSLMAPRLFGQAGLQFTVLVTTALANHLPAVVNQDLKSAWTLVTLPVGVFAVALATPAFPTLSTAWARGDTAAFVATLTSTLQRVLFLILPATTILLLLRAPIVDLLFHHGRFSSTDADLTATIFIFYAIGIPAHAGVEVLPRAFFALKNTRTPVIVNLWTLGLTVLLSVLAVALLPGTLGAAGLAFALSMGVTAEAVWLLWSLQQRLHSLPLRRLSLSILRLSGATAVAALIGLVLDSHIPTPIPTDGFVLRLIIDLVHIAIVGGVAAATYLVAAMALRADSGGLLGR